MSPGDKGFECDKDPNSDNDNSYEIRLLNEDLILEPICWKECTDCDGNYISKIDVNRPWPPFERIVIEKGFIFAMNFLVPSTVILIMTLFIRFCSQPSKRTSLHQRLIVLGLCNPFTFSLFYSCLFSSK